MGRPADQKYGRDGKPAHSGGCAATQAPRLAPAVPGWVPYAISSATPQEFRDPLSKSRKNAPEAPVESEVPAEAAASAEATAAPNLADGVFGALPDAVDEVMRINLDQFEGPFEVLLYLIKSQEIDIFDIPILKITEQYLAFLDQLRGENLDVAGEFIVMAATLIQIKARMLIPVEVETEDDDDPIEEEDPRLELVEKLLEYRKFRDYSELLERQFDEADDWFGRSAKPKIEIDPEELELVDVDIYDLTKAIRAILKFMTDAPIHQVIGEGSSIEEKISLIQNFLESADSVTWNELVKVSKTRVEIVCCLLAILELCRMRRIRAHQHEAFSNIRLFARNEAEEPPAEFADVVEA
ncbi:MAG: hypothetical protein GC168_03040 [Candidatus Hydrogenedens sp.]|nr:hypothetical protein [Candidatus Hydrogenedens sp.]